MDNLAREAGEIRTMLSTLNTLPGMLYVSNISGATTDPFARNRLKFGRVRMALVAQYDMRNSSGQCVMLCLDLLTEQWYQRELVNAVL